MKDKEIRKSQISSAQALGGIIAINQEILRLRYKKREMALQAHVNLDESAKRLHDKLREWRDETARSRNLPGSYIVRNAALLDIASKRPGSEHELLEMHGIGDAKLEQYGRSILEIVREHEESEKGSDKKDVTSKKHILRKKDTPRPDKA